MEGNRVAESRTQLHDDLIAILRAGRELSPDADAHLAEIFLNRIDRVDEAMTSRASAALQTRIPSLVLLAALWGALLAFLIPTSLHAWSNIRTNDGRILDAVILILVLLLAVALSRAVLYVGRYGLTLPRIRINVSPPLEEVK